MTSGQLRNFERTTFGKKEILTIGVRQVYRVLLRLSFEIKGHNFPIHFSEKTSVKQAAPITYYSHHRVEATAWAWGRPFAPGSCLSVLLCWIFLIAAPRLSHVSVAARIDVVEPAQCHGHIDQHNAMRQLFLSRTPLFSPVQW